MKNIITPLIIAVSILFVSNVSAQKKNSKILFLEFRFIKGTPQLVGMTTVKGKLKTRKGDTLLKPGYTFEVLSKTSKVVYKNSIDNPVETVYEYPGENGEIKRAQIKQDTVNVTIRTPYCSSIDKIILYKVDGAKALAKTSAKEKYEFKIDHALIKKEK